MAKAMRKSAWSHKPLFKDGGVEIDEEVVRALLEKAGLHSEKASLASCLWRELYLHNNPIEVVARKLNIEVREARDLNTLLIRSLRDGNNTENGMLQ
jgi:hypothetical protein